MADGKYKPYSFYIPEKDAELQAFMAAQSNTSLSMRLLIKAFIASNRHATDLDVSVMDLADLIRCMRVDPELFSDVPRRRRPARSISAIEAEEARDMASQGDTRAAELQSGAAGMADRSQPGFGQRLRQPGPSVPEPEPAGQAYNGAPASVPAPEPAPPASWPAPAPAAFPGSPDPSYGHAAPVQAGAAPGDGDEDMDPMSMMGEGY